MELKAKWMGIPWNWTEEMGEEGRKKWRSLWRCLYSRQPDTGKRQNRKKMGDAKGKQSCAVSFTAP